ncbi:MAG TPA: protein translocase subunit SecD [Streptosporangiaceae bacterium]|nr:protein translocase subunit SecD [Streptosporangiaceae bacterium]
MTSPSKPSRPRGNAWPGSSSSTSKQGSAQSRPGVHLAALAVLIFVMLAAVIGGAALHPADWHHKFKVGLGLDLHGGTTVTLKAVASNGGVPNKTDMNTAISILESRFNGLGINNTTVQQQGAQFINISIPGASASQIAPLLSSASLRFRQVLLCTTALPTNAACQPGPHPAGPGLPAAAPSAPTTPPAPIPAPTPVPSSGPSHSSSPKAQPSSSPSSKASKSGGSGQAVGARQLSDVTRDVAKPLASASPTPSSSGSPKASASPSASPSASSKTKSSPSASPSASPSPSPSVSAPSANTLYVAGNESMVSAKTLDLFKKLDCRKAGWQHLVYGNESNRYDNETQIVACDGTGVKYVLGPPIVQGTELKSPGAALSSTSNQWVVTFNLNGPGSTAFGAKTTQMVNTYYNSTQQQETSVLDQFAIVLDGKVVSAPLVQQAITGGSGQITGNFTQKSATNLANVLKYGALPLSFDSQTIQSVSAQLGSQQLDAGLIAAAVGLLLVVFYSFFYYRGLALVSVFSLAIAALLSWLAVILLGKYQGYSLTLAGVAGLIVAIGITADSFVVYFERLRDEVREGRTLRAAVERGWTRARRTILVSDTVSFLAALLLYIFAIGDVKGFAFTLGLTTLIDVVVVFSFTKPMVTLLARTKFYSSGRPLSGLDPARLGARSPWRGSRPATPRPATGSAASAVSARTTPKEA